MTNEFKKLILNQINSFRSLIATGQKTPFKSASNMRLVVSKSSIYIKGHKHSSKKLIQTWNSEMEYISKLGLIKGFENRPCYQIDNFPMARLYGEFLPITESPSAFLTLAFEDFFKDIDYTARLITIGCSFSSYKNLGKTLHCFSSPGTEAYLQGSPCSECSMFNQVCSKKFQGLCEDSLKEEESENESEEHSEHSKKGKLFLNDWKFK